MKLQCAYSTRFIFADRSSLPVRTYKPFECEPGEIRAQPISRNTTMSRESAPRTVVAPTTSSTIHGTQKFAPYVNNYRVVVSGMYKREEG
jgi:hypothetical protein